MKAGLREMAERTPSDRDRYVDFLRAFSIATVVVGHWFIALIYYEDGRVFVHNAVGVTRGLWMITWLLQVMPIFFFVGGFSNLKTYDAVRQRGGSYGEFLRLRLARLLKPTAVFGALWLVVQIVFHLVDVGGEGLVRFSLLPFAPLWFLIVYMFVLAATPWSLRLHRSLGSIVVAALIGAVVVGDVLRFADVAPPPGWANLAFVWLLAHQLGYFYGDGRLLEAGRGLWTAMTTAGLGGLIVLTNIGIYPRSMVGTDIERVSNMNPPTLCIVALAFWQIGLAMLLRDRVREWLDRPKAWMAVIAANSMIMTIFLWHMTAFVIAVAALYPLGLGHPTDTDLSWWLQRPIWLGVPGLVLAVLVLIFLRFERPGRRKTSSPAVRVAGDRTTAG